MEPVQTLKFYFLFPLDNLNLILLNLILLCISFFLFSLDNQHHKLHIIYSETEKLSLLHGNGKVKYADNISTDTPYLKLNLC